MIKPGDKFNREGISRTVWIVVRKANLVQSILPHFQLAHAKKRSRTIMMSASALLDENLYKRVEEIDGKVKMAGKVRLDGGKYGKMAFRSQPTHQNQAFGRRRRGNRYTGGAIWVQSL